MREQLSQLVVKLGPHVMQAAELLFGAAGRPHDYLQETLLRLLGVGFFGAATQNWVLKVSTCAWS